MTPLAGIRVVNLAVNLPGPAAARRLQLLGASVVKIEPPAGDPMELYHAGWYRDMSKDQQVVKLDLKSAEGRETLAGLFTVADLLISATRPAAMERLGLGWNELHGKYPRLCQVAITGYPAPRENEAGHDLTYQASLGLLTPPHMPRTLMADMAGAEQTLSASLELLLRRERCKESGYTEVALSTAAEWMAEPLRYGCTAEGAILGGGIPEYNVFKALDGWVAVAALEPHFKKRLEDNLQISSAAGYEAVFQTKKAADWEKWGQELDVPVVAVK
ncbi:MAG: CoA transferase [Geobacteraceae bacterium]|nr:CoA transferase [Geobacteraceae bacterium]